MLRFKVQKCQCKDDLEEIVKTAQKINLSSWKTRMKMSIDLIKCNKRVTFREREREGDSFRILYMGYLLFIVKIKREEEERKERERKKCDIKNVT